VKGVTEIAEGQRETLAALTNLGKGLRALSKYRQLHRRVEA
jgi:hypothetical protein